jgi:hypothetical protein
MPAQTNTRRDGLSRSGGVILFREGRKDNECKKRSAVSVACNEAGHVAFAAVTRFVPRGARRANADNGQITPKGAPVKEWIAVLKAADAAARWHVHQRRKGAAEEPYINHLLEVASLVAEATHGKDPNLVIAALLHDAIEDQEVPREMIAESFGEDVARLVEELTDDKTLDAKARKRAQVEHARGKSQRAKIIKLADKTSNVRTITASPPADWSVKRRLAYVQWGRDVVAGLRGANAWLEDEFDKAAAAAEASLRP